MTKGLIYQAAFQIHLKEKCAMSFPKQAQLFKALIQELRETAKAFGYGGLTRSQKSSVSYAFAQIQPKSVDELAAVIALGLQQKSTHETVDRYVAIRTKGDTTFIPFNKIENMNELLVKTWGLLIYKEYAQILLEELTGRPYGVLPATILLDRETLVQCLKVELKTTLTERDIDILHEAFLMYTRVGMNSYKWCRDMADRIVQNAV